MFGRTLIALGLVGLGIAMPAVAVAQAPAASSSVDTIRVGQNLSQWSRLRPGTRRYLRYMTRGGRRVAMDIWSRTLSFEPDPAGGGQRLHIAQTWNGATLPMERSVDSWFEMGTFRPLTHRTRAQRGDQNVVAAFVFTPAAVRGDSTVADNSQAALNVATPEPTFNFETDMEMLSALPWREGYTARINFYHPGGGVPEWYDYRVTGSEAASLGGHPIDCWVVAISYGAQGDARFWIDKETQAVVKVETRGPDIEGTLYKILLPDEAAG
jgi:hypothetical protein